MRLSSQSALRKSKLELAMTPMIDLVFLLLIYSMTTMNAAKTERDLPSEIKDRDRAARAAASDLEPAIVEIVRSGDRFVYRLGGRELVSVAELTSLLQQFPNKLDGAYVRVSDAAPFRMAAAAVQACRDARFTAVAYVPMD